MRNALRNESPLIIFGDAGLFVSSRKSSRGISVFFKRSAARHSTKYPHLYFPPLGSSALLSPRFPISFSPALLYLPTGNIGIDDQIRIGT